MAARGELYPSYGGRPFDSPEEAARNGLTSPPLTALASYADDDMAFVILSDPDGDLWEAIVRLSLDGWVFLGGGHVGQTDPLHAVSRHRGEELGFVARGGRSDDNERAVVEFHSSTYD